MQRISIWDILSIVVIIMTLCMCGAFAQIFMDPYSGLNLFPPPTPLPTVSIIIPTYTPTQRELPATWTPTPQPNDSAAPGAATLKPSSTIAPTYTVYVIPSFTPTHTPTNTPTNTPTATNTATRTPLPTNTPVPTFTPIPSWTLPPTWTVPAP